MRTAAIYAYSAVPDDTAARRQRERCQALARTLGLRVTVTVADEAGDRTGLAALLEQANLGHVDAVQAASLVSDVAAPRPGQRAGAS